MVIEVSDSQYKPNISDSEKNRNTVTCFSMALNALNWEDGFLFHIYVLPADLGIWILFLIWNESSN